MFISSKENAIIKVPVQKAIKNGRICGLHPKMKQIIKAMNNKVEDVYVLPYSNEHFLDIPNVIDSLIFAGMDGLTLMNLISI